MCWERLCKASASDVQDHIICCRCMPHHGFAQHSPSSYPTTVGQPGVSWVQAGRPRPIPMGVWVTPMMGDPYPWTFTTRRPARDCAFDARLSATAHGHCAQFPLVSWVPLPNGRLLHVVTCPTMRAGLSRPFFRTLSCLNQPCLRIFAAHL